ncbi:MAG: diguanylate cyclase [Acidobacteriaceae bacterium]
MELELRNSLTAFFLPSGAILAVLVLMLQRGVLVPDVQFATFCWYAAFGVGVVLALRFRSVRLLFSLIALALASLAPEALPGRYILTFVGILLPVNLVVFSVMEDRGFSKRELLMRAGFFFAQFIAIAFLSRPELESTAALFDRRWLAVLPSFGAPHLGVLVSMGAAALFAFRFWVVRKPIESGFFWATAACLLAVASGSITIMKFYVAAAGGLLTMSLMESSYRMAYHDELTGLPARRAFNDALNRVGDRYAIAVVDIDHFKRFNDTYGHETGDQVLRMVASKLARVSGGGESFRFGGEEFCILFPGRSIKEALPYLERLRADIADAAFFVRGQDRVVKSIEHRSGGQPRSNLEARVTVSIGVAGSSGKLVKVDESLRAADKALYRAKQEGRNRVEVAAAWRRVANIADVNVKEA